MSPHSVLVLAGLALSALLATSAVALLRARDPFALVALLSVYSGLLAATFAVMGAVDVAFMEAVVGTSVSTVFLLALMWWIDPHACADPVPRRAAGSAGRWLAAALAPLGLGGVLLHGVSALPAFGDPATPPLTRLSPHYVERALEDMATPNVVTAVLADYRGLDTLIESAVVVTAVLACLLVLRHRDDSSL